MRIIFLVVGRMKSGPERELVDEYIKRAGPIARSLGFRGIEEVEVASGGGLDVPGGKGGGGLATAMFEGLAVKMV